MAAVPINILSSPLFIMEAQEAVDYSIDAIKKLQSYFKSLNIINHDFNQIKINHFKLNKWNVFTISVFIVHLIKYMFHCIATNRPKVSNILANLFEPFGLTGSFCTFGVLFATIWSSIMVLAFIYNQINGHSDVLSDLGMFVDSDINLIRIHDGNKTVGRTKLTIESISKVTKMVKYLIYLPPIFGYCCPIAGFALFSTSIYLKYRDMNCDFYAYMMLIYESIWACGSILFVSMYAFFICLQCVMFFISSMYIELRFQQLYSGLDTIISECNDVESSYEAGRILEQLDDYICDFNSTCDKVHRYNHLYRYFLFCMSYCGMGLFIVCFFVMVPKYHESPIEKYIKWPFSVTGIETNLIIAFFASVAGNIHSTSKSFYSKFNTLFVKGIVTSGHEGYGHRYNWFPKKIQNKLWLTILRLSSDHCPVSFYCLNLHPFTHLYFVQLTMSTFIHILLAFQLSQKQFNN